MSEEVNGLVSPQEMPEAPVAETVDTKAESTTNSENVTEESSKVEKPEDKTPKWTQKRIDELTKRRYEAEGRSKALEEQNREYQRQLAQLIGRDVGEPNRAPEADIDALIDQRAEQKSFAAYCTKTYKEIVKETPEFAHQYEQLKSAADITDEALAVIMDSDNPKQLLRHLASDLDAATELLELSPVRMAREIAKIEIKLANTTKPKASAAPKPLEPVKTNSKTSDEPDQNDTARWIKWSMEQDAKKRR